MITASERSTYTVAGTRAYVGENKGLFVLDVGKPRQPQHLGYIPLGEPVRAIHVVSNLVYVATAAAGTGGLRIFDVRGPTKPSLVGKYDVEQG